MSQVFGRYLEVYRIFIRMELDQSVIGSQIEIPLRRQTGRQHHPIDVFMGCPAVGFSMVGVQPEGFDFLDKRGVPRQRPDFGMDGMFCVEGVRSAFHEFLQFPRALQADGQPQLPEGETVVRWKVQVTASGIGAEAPAGCREQVFKKVRPLEMSADDELGQPVGVAQQAAQTQRIVGGPVPPPAEVGHVGDLRMEVRAFSVPGFGCFELLIGDEAVQGIMMAHGGDQRVGKVDAHFPVHPLRASGGGRVGEPFMDRFGQFPRPSVVIGVAGGPAHLVQGVHPFGQVMEILAVPIPFGPIIKWLCSPPFGSLLSDAESASGGMMLSFGFVQAADPSGPRVVFPVFAQHLMDLIDEAERQVTVSLFRCLTVQREEVADGECVCPEIAARGDVRRHQAGAFRKTFHDVAGRWRGFFLYHLSSRLSFFTHCIIPFRRPTKK